MIGEKNKFMNRIIKTLIGLSIIFFLITIYLFFIGQISESGPFMILFFLFLALGIRVSDRFKGLTFTILINCSSFTSYNVWNGNSNEF